MRDSDIRTPLGRPQWCTCTSVLCSWSLQYFSTKLNLYNVGQNLYNVGHWKLHDQLFHYFIALAKLFDFFRSSFVTICFNSRSRMSGRPSLKTNPSLFWYVIKQY